MLVSLARFIAGSRSYTVSPEDSVKASDILMRSGAEYRNLRIRDRRAHFVLTLRDCDAIERIFSREGINFTRISEHGLPKLIRRYRKRIGIPLGILLFFVMLTASGSVIWQIDVIGCEKLDSDTVISRLRELGCGVGTYVPSVDFDELHASYLLKYTDTAWISVNVRGTHAVAEIKETELPETRVDEKIPHNLVAAEDTVIYSIEIHRGTPVVGVGDLVRKGELIASGMTDIKSGYLLFHARGEVKGTVERSIHIEVPLENTRLEPTGCEFYEKRLSFFGKTVKFFDNTDNLRENDSKISYNKAERQTKLSLLGAVQLPFEISKTVYSEYAEVPVSYTEEEAKREAYSKLRAELAALTEDGEMVGRETEAWLNNGVFTIDCKVTLICDIAAEQPIYTDKIQEK